MKPAIISLLLVVLSRWVAFTLDAAENPRPAAFAPRPVATRERGPVTGRRIPHTLRVTATAYNSIRRETSSTPNYGAWGDRLRPGMKAIAVSRDLLRLGLTRGVRVRISGLPGTYRVLDKMARRWRRRIDIYMGLNVKAALRWGKRPVRIWWYTERRSRHPATGHSPA